MIQTAVRKQLDSSITVLTVAHRLSTIKDYDKVVRPYLVPRSYDLTTSVGSLCSMQEPW